MCVEYLTFFGVTIRMSYLSRWNFFEGSTLAAWLNNNTEIPVNGDAGHPTLDTQFLAPIIRQMADGLDAAHQIGIIHGAQAG